MATRRRAGSIPDRPADDQLGGCDYLISGQAVSAQAGNASTSVAAHRPRVIARAGGARCLNLVAPLCPMPQARWQCLKIFGTGHQLLQRHQNRSSARHWCPVPVHLRHETRSGLRCLDLVADRQLGSLPLIMRQLCRSPARRPGRDRRPGNVAPFRRGRWGCRPTPDPPLRAPASVGREPSVSR
jgi:hypothetical protein